MNNIRAPRDLPRLSCVVAIARIRITRVLRTGLGVAALIIAGAPWLLVEGTTLFARLSALAEFSVVGLTVLAAGAIADDIDSGEYAILLTHGVSAIEAIAGGAIGSSALGLVIVALQLPIALRGVVTWQLSTMLLCMFWLAALLAGWVGIMLLFATMLSGKANAVAMVGLLIAVPVGLGSGLLERFPPVPAAVVRSALQAIPQINYVNAMFRAVIYRSPAPPLATVVLLTSPMVWFTLAALRLNRIEAAGRLTQ